MTASNLSKAPLEERIENNNKHWTQFFTDLVSEIKKARGGAPIQAPEYTVATVPDATTNEGAMIYVSDETGGAVIAFSDGSDWRRVTDRAVVS